MPNKNISKLPKFQLKTVGVNCYGITLFGLQQPLILPPASAP
jgi:hypothetical protein